MTFEMGKKLWWCTYCNVPLLDNICQNCGRKGIQICSDLRPVFVEEAKIIEEETDFKLPACGWQEGLWERQNTLWWKGKKILHLVRDLSGIRIDKVYDYDVLDQSDSNIYVDQNLLYSANKEYFTSLIEEACQFIKDLILQYPEKMPVVSFSGGKDSTVVSYLARKALKQEDMPHIFGDTTMEYPDTYNYIKEFKENNPDISFYIGKPPSDFFDMCNLLGPPSRINAWCCSVFKAAPIAMVVNGLNGESGVISFEGIRRKESARRRNRDRTYINKKIVRELSAYPILDWKEIEVWMTILINDLKFNPAYLSGFTRIGCLYCPHNSPRNEYLLSKEYPTQIKNWENFICKYAQSIGKTNPKEYFFTGSWKSRVGKTDGNSLVYVKKVECMKNPNAMHFILDRPIDYSFIERFKPFGIIKQFSDDKGEGFYVIDRYSGEKLFMIKIVKDITILLNESKIDPNWKLGNEFLCVDLLTTKNQYHLMQSIERQLRKYQVCVSCGACAGVCPTGAIKINPHFRVDGRKCIHCDRCISSKFIKSSCVAINSFQQSRRYRDVNRI